MRIRACGVVTADGDFFHAQLREKKRWDEAGCAGCRNTCAGCADRAPESASISGEAPYRTPWHGADFRVEPLGDPYYRHHEKHHEHEQPETYVEHPWTHFWASSRAPRRWSGLEARPTAAAADACAQDAEREFYSGCLGTCGKTCDELGHDPVLFEKLKDAVKRWPDAGGGEAIPDVCGFDATIAWDADPTWWTWRQVHHVGSASQAMVASKPQTSGIASPPPASGHRFTASLSFSKRTGSWPSSSHVFPQVPRQPL